MEEKYREPNKNWFEMMRKGLRYRCEAMVQPALPGAFI